VEKENGIIMRANAEGRVKKYAIFLQFRKETLFGKKIENKQKISEIPKQIKNDQNDFFL
jgi:hypothetical protein